MFVDKVHKFLNTIDFKIIDRFDGYRSNEDYRQRRIKLYESGIRKLETHGITIDLSENYL